MNLTKSHAGRLHRAVETESLVSIQLSHAKLLGEHKIPRRQITKILKIGKDGMIMEMSQSQVKTWSIPIGLRLGRSAVHLQGRPRPTF